MNSKMIFDSMRGRLPTGQAQYDALLRILNAGAAPEDVAALISMPVQVVSETESTGNVLSKRSLDRLVGVHPDLVQVVKRAIELSTYDFMVVEGLRSLDTQKQYKAAGKSQTLDSYHLKQRSGYGHAVDLAPLEGNSIDWSNSRGQFDEVARAMQAAAKELGVQLTWGGDWKSFIDKPHFQVPR